MKKLIPIALAVMSATCTSHRALRPVAEVITTSVAQIKADEQHRKEVAARSFEHHIASGRREFDLAIIELDDQGWLWNPRQLRLALDQTEQAAKDTGAIVVMFFHGWKNNADVCNVNLSCFRDALALLAREEATAAGKLNVAARRVVGIYPAWRGLSLKFPKNFSFWGRKETAHRVGRAAALDVVAEFSDLHRRYARSTRTRLVFIGHSFGAAVLYEASASLLRGALVTAMHRPVTTGCQPARSEIDEVETLGDLMVLVNPAFEASLYHDVDVQTHWFSMYSRLQTPALITVASEGDWATRNFFPVGRSVSTIAQRTRGRDQRAALQTTIGNYEPFYTHTLKRVTPPESEGPISAGKCGCPVSLLALDLSNILLPETDPCKLNLAATRRYGSVLLEKLPDVSADNPFSVITTDKKVITDHEGIFTAPFFEFLVRYVAAIDQKKRLPQP